MFTIDILRSGFGYAYIDVSHVDVYDVMQTYRVHDWNTACKFYLQEEAL